MDGMWGRGAGIRYLDWKGELGTEEGGGKQV